jgi:DNA end-binding protein Ku
VMARRERVVAIRPMGKGLVVHTLHEERDLNSPEKAFDGVPDGKPDKEMVALAEQLITRQAGKFDPGDFEDRYESRLRALIDAKLKGKGIEPEQEDEADRGNVIDLMDALRRSLGGKSGDKEAPAKPAKRPSKAPAKAAPAPPKRRAAKR